MGFFSYAHHFSLDGYGQDYGPGKTNPTQVAKRVIEVAKSLQAIDRPALSTPDILQPSKSHYKASRPDHLQGGLMCLSPEEKAELEAQLDQMRIKLEARKQQKLREAKKAGLTNRGSRRAKLQDRWDSSENDGHASLIPSQPNPLSRVSPPMHDVPIPSPHGDLHASSPPPRCLSSETALPLGLAETRKSLPSTSPGQREDVGSDGDGENGSDSEVRTTAEPQSLPVVPHLSSPNVSGTSQGCVFDDVPTTKVKRRRSPLSSLSKLIPGGFKSRSHALKHGPRG